MLKCYYDVHLLYSMIYHQSLLKVRTSVNIIPYDDIHCSGMTRDNLVKLSFRYTIRASVTALAVSFQLGMDSFLFFVVVVVF